MVTFIHSLSLSLDLSLSLSLSLSLIIQEIVEILNNCIRDVRVFWSFNTPETNTNKESVFGIKTLTSVLL